MTHTALIHDGSAQTMAEYSVVLGLMILGVVAAIALFGGAVAQYIETFAGAIG